MGTAAALPHPGHRPGAATVVKLEGLTKVYRIGDVSVEALVDIDLEVDEGEFVVVLGPSGCGKTTLLNMIGGLDTPSSGRAEITGRSIVGMKRSELFAFRRNSVSFIFQSFNLFPGLTALENVQFAVDVAGRSRGPDEAAAILASVGLADRIHHFPHELSGGEQQRVAIARALGTGNPLLLADEPTGELDFRTGVQILRLLEEQAIGGKAVLAVTHNREISRAADRVIELSSGRKVSDGPPAGGRAPIEDLHW
jgi:putative ABC transport system ATP-binding protein